jgi:hypothetical protein
VLESGAFLDVRGEQMKIGRDHALVCFGYGDDGAFGRLTVAQSSFEEIEEKTRALIPPRGQRQAKVRDQHAAGQRQHDEQRPNGEVSEALGHMLPS